MILGSLGSPLGRPWGGFWVTSFEAKKNDEKKVWKPLASAGDADPGQDPPAGFLKKDSARLHSPWDGGRADCSGRAEPPPAPF